MSDVVIFACVHNAGRSQMAAAFFNKLVEGKVADGTLRGPLRPRAVSAGTKPGPHVHPEVVTVMKEVGIDLSRVEPRLLTDELASQATWLVTMGCGEVCPAIPGIKREDWQLEDPKGKPLERVREIRDDIKKRVEAFITRNAWG